MMNGLSSFLPGSSQAQGQSHAPSEPQGALSSWATVSTYLSQVAADAAMDLPPLQKDAGLLRMCHVLAELCHFTYVTKTADVGTTTSIAVPSMGLLSERAAVSAELVHFREAASTGHELDVPQQFGVWQIAGLGIVVAFRGTASQEDVIIDANISPVPLDLARSTRGRSAIKVHGGFYNGAKRHLAEIATVVRACDEKAGRRLPVWVTGHSLGGGYANALALHLLAQRNTAELFGAGGGTVTFGAPMVVYSERPASMYSQLQAMERAAEASGGSGAPQLQFHNLVNNADVVPRLLGTSLESLHGLLEAYIPMIQRVRNMAKHYHPFGTYHFIVGSQIRTPPHQKPQLAALLSPSSSTTEQQAERFLGGVGDEAYGKEITNQLDSSNLWRTFFVGSGRGGGVTHHSILSYQERLYGYLEQLALQQTAAAATLPSGQRAASREAEDTASLFRQAPSPRAENPLLDEFGRFAGSVRAIAATELRRSMTPGLAQTASTYRNTLWKPWAGSLGAIAATELGRSMATGLAQRATTYWNTPRAARPGSADTAASQGASTVHVSESASSTAAAGTAGSTWSISKWWNSTNSHQSSEQEHPTGGRGRGESGRSPPGRGRGRGRGRDPDL